MAVEYTLWMQKTKEGSEVKDSLSAFGFAVCAIPWPSEETEDVSVRVWPGQHGEDAYIPPSGLKLKAYDVEVEFCFKSSVLSLESSEGSAYEAYKALRNYLTGIDGSGGELKIYDPYWRRGRKKVRVKKIGDLDPHRSNVDEVLSAKVTFRVADPVTEIGVGKDANGNIVSLGAV
ncbi:MAG: hypothetical protein K2N48_01275 [Muribaculaceae bacterium]|nr:hypothetical protein [Muribaculaceae bacterium]